MGTNCAPLVDDLFLFCYERDFMMYFSDDKQADVIDAFNTTSSSCEHCYWRVMVRVRRLLGTFSISAYPVC